MKTTYFASLLVGLAAVLGTSSAQPASPTPPTLVTPEIERTLDQLRAQALASDHAYEIVESLVTEVGPRLAGSPAEARARDWAQAMLTREGFTNARIEPFTIRYWDATLERAEIVTQNGAPRPLVAAALGGSPSTPAGGLEGEVVRVASLAELERTPEIFIRGRIVFVDERMTRAQDGSGYGPAVAKRSGCAPRAQAKGAIACVIRSVGTDAHRFAHQGGASRQPDGADLPSMALAPADADVVAGLLARGSVRLRLEIVADRREEAPSGNVIAEVRGRERPNEVVLLAAHLDSWDMGHGAIDDGAGVAIITAAAKLIRDLPRRPRRTIRLLLAGAEENVGGGDRAYLANHGGDVHVLAGESDFGAGRVWKLDTRFDASAAGHARALAAALAPLGVINGANTASGGADVQALARTGAALVDLNQDGSDYFDYHHTANDTLDKIDPDALRQNVAAWAVTAYLAAESDWTFAAPTPQTSQ